MLEIIAAAVFDAFFASKGPTISLFSRFKEKWRFIDQDKYDPLDSETTGCVLQTRGKQWLDGQEGEVIELLKDQLRQKHPRADYLESIELALVLLGVREFRHRFRPPGAYHCAWLIAKGIYCLQIFAFREQFTLTTHERQALQRICLFTISIYIKAWVNAASSSHAPINDLRLLRANT